MATLTNNINPQNIVDRFADYVTATASAGISWGTNAKPFTQFDAANFGGPTTGRPIGITGTTISPVGGTITAAAIYNALVNETAQYTSIRSLRAILHLTGSGNQFDQTAVAYMNMASYGQSIGSPANAGVSAGSTITSSNLESFFNNLRSSYNTARAATTTITVTVCHTSCHSSCHGSRGRR
jgi:hypothetical protein